METRVGEMLLAADQRHPLRSARGLRGEETVDRLRPPLLDGGRHDGEQRHEELAVALRPHRHHHRLHGGGHAHHRAHLVIGAVAIAGNARQDRSNGSECGHHFYEIEQA